MKRYWPLLGMLAVAALICPQSCLASDDLADKIKAVIDAPQYRQARWGMLFVDALSGKTVFERDSDRLFTPASTTKLFSCAAALCQLGPEHRFETPVYVRGTRKGGTIRGDLIIVASGDLTLGSRTGKDGCILFSDHDHIYAGGTSPCGLPDCSPTSGLDDLAAQIAGAGVKEIDGEVVIDDRLFDRASGSGSGPSMLTPIMINDNIIDLIITPGAKVGDPATVRTRPETAYAQLDADVTTSSGWFPPRLSVRATGTGRISVRGQVGKGSTPTIAIVPVDDPAGFARALFIEALRRQGVRVAAGLYRAERWDLPSTKEYKSLERIAVHKSAPFSEVIKVTLKVSHNLYASTLPILIAAKHGERTLEKGLRRQGQFLRELGVATEPISCAGGAGGARADAITPRAAVQLLYAMGKRPEATAFFNALPLLGVDGTLVHVVDKDSPARGKVAAKTGTLGWRDVMNDRNLLRSKALAGVMETAKGTRLYFAMFVNDVPLPLFVTSTREGKVLGKLCEIVYQHGP